VLLQKGMHIEMTKQLRKYFIFVGPFLIILIVGIFVESSMADMYKWVDQNGVIHFSDRPPHNVDNSTIETLPTHTTDEKNARLQEKNATENKNNVSNTTDPVQKYTLVKEPEVELYITSWCPWCKKAKAFFRSRGIAFVEYDIEKDKEAARRKEKIDRRKGVPFAVINGKSVHGYNEKGYNNALSN